MKKLSPISRIVIAIASLSLIATYFLPVWFIYLIAPQYPEGLEMNIWLYQITGQVEIINGLNHYIGMKHISAEMFPEFNFLVYIVGFFILFGLMVAITGSRKLLLAYLITTVLGGAAALADFYKWGYDYGHNLDPTAAIQVPGLSYQPPVIGHKTLLNFDAFSYPDTGGWVVIVASAIFFLVYFFEWRRNRKEKKNVTTTKHATIATGVAACLFISSCSTEPQKINYGKDQCDECRMTIMDTRFGGEIVTKKGRAYKFDDAHCMASFLNKRKVALKDMSHTLTTDYNHKEKFLPVHTAHFVLSSKLKSPMGSNAAAFATKEEAEKKATELEGKVTDWATLYNIIK